MAKHIFANFGTTVQGEAEDVDHIGWCEIYDLNWTLESKGSPTSEDPPSEHERGSFKELEVKKKMDKGSTGLAKLCWEGGSIAEVVIDCYRSAGGEIGGIKYMELRLKNVVIKEYKITLSEGDDEPPEEELNLAFDYIRITYLPMDKITGAAGGQLAVEMDTQTA